MIFETQTVQFNVAFRPRDVLLIGPMSKYAPRHKYDLRRLHKSRAERRFVFVRVPSPQYYYNVHCPYEPRCNGVKYGNGIFPIIRLIYHDGVAGMQYRYAAVREIIHLYLRTVFGRSC